jgi:hypothetical protein
MMILWYILKIIALIAIGTFFGGPLAGFCFALAALVGVMVVKVSKL